MCSFKVFVFFALASMLVLSHFATAIPSLPSEVDLDETPEEIVDDQRPPESLANSLDEMPVEVIFSLAFMVILAHFATAKPSVSYDVGLDEILPEKLGQCVDIYEFCTNRKKCCPPYTCKPFYRSPDLCQRK
nr:PREDICTED: uncharacterized protein LOC109030186 isoform X4 [Bemisia tabaci]